MSSTTCPNCGVQVSADDRFCSNCGARLGAFPTEADTSLEGAERPGLEPDTSPGEPTPGAEPVLPTLGRKNSWEYERDRVHSAADEDEWRMSDLGPPPPRKRRTWLWIVIGILALMVLLCCIFLYWVGYTDGGQEWFEGIATEAAEIVEATQQASATPES